MSSSRGGYSLVFSLIVVVSLSVLFVSALDTNALMNKITTIKHIDTDISLRLDFYNDFVQKLDLNSFNPPLKSIEVADDDRLDIKITFKYLQDITIYDINIVSKLEVINGHYRGLKNKL